MLLVVNNHHLLLWLRRLGVLDSRCLRFDSLTEKSIQTATSLFKDGSGLSQLSIDVQIGLQ